MCVPTESPLVQDFVRLARNRAGLALPTALFALVVVSLLCLGVFLMTDLEAKSSRNRERSVRAMQLAEAGGAHAISILRSRLKDTSMTRLLRGWNAGVGSDDGLIIDYPGLDATTSIPASGRSTVGGTYYVQLVDDPGENPDVDPRTDVNGRILARCKGVTTDGAIAEVDAIIGIVSLPAVAVDGDLKLNGNPQLIGLCGGAHANGDLDLSGNPTVTTTGKLTASDSVISGGNATDQSGNPVAPQANQPEQEIPDLNPMDYCGDANYEMLDNGQIWRKSDNTYHNANGSSNAKFGWFYDSSKDLWEQKNTVSPGTLCFHGNVKMPNEIGSAGTPLLVSIIAEGSIDVGGKPHFSAAHPENITMMAGGDIKFGGDLDALEDTYSGLVYADAQCNISGNPRITGQLICKNNPQPAGADQLAVLNEISGNPTIQYGCAGNLLARRRILYWYPKVGA